MSDPLVEVITKRLGSPIFTTGSEVRFNCFKKSCGATGTEDSGHHMYVNPDKGKYFCQRCQAGGTIDHLLEVLGLESPDGTLSTWNRVLNNFLFGSPVEDKVVREVELPADFVSVFQGSKASEYLSSRWISPRRTSKYNLGIGTTRLRSIDKELHWKYAGRNRIVFPDYDPSGKLVYWVARTYAAHRAKYKNAKVSRDNKIYNLGRIQQRGYKDRIVICEGPISAILAGYDAVATYGKYITGSQIQLLVDHAASEYVVALDGDAVPEAVSLASRLFKRGLDVRFVRFRPHEDPASVGPMVIRRMIRSAMKWTANSAMEVML